MKRTFRLRNGALATLLTLAGHSFIARGEVRPAGTSNAQALFEKHCRACHGSGPDKPGTVALATRYEGAVPAELALRRDLSADMVRAVIRIGMANMPPFRKTEITDAELDSLAGWLAQNPERRAPRR